MRRVVLVPINKGKGTYTAEDNYFVVSDYKQVVDDSVKSVNGQLPNAGNVVLTTGHIYDSSDRHFMTDAEQSALAVSASISYVGAAFAKTLKQITAASSSVLTGITSSQTMIYTFAIPANTIIDNKANMIVFPFEKTAGQGMNLWMFVSASSGSLGSQLAYYGNSSASRITGDFSRKFFVSGGQLDPFKWPVGSGAITNLGNAGAGGTPTTIAVDSTQIIYIHVACSFTTSNGDIQIIHPVLHHE